MSKNHKKNLKKQKGGNMVNTIILIIIGIVLLILGCMWIYKEYKKYRMTIPEQLNRNVYPPSYPDGLTDGQKGTWARHTFK
jgi:hypothetical protein